MKNLPAALLLAYLVVWSICAINPLYPDDWLLENVLVFLFIPIIIRNHLVAPLSNTAYIMLFLFFCLHSLGTHYTYAEVPYDNWWQSLSGHTINEQMGWQRNHYDRLVHFAYGLLTTVTWAELLLRNIKVPGTLWRWAIVFCFISSHGMFYELVEWGAAEYFGGDLGVAYLGTQGDVWDAHKDMLLASIGSAITLTWMTLTGRLSHTGSPHRIDR